MAPRKRKPDVDMTIEEDAQEVITADDVFDAEGTLIIDTSELEDFDEGALVVTKTYTAAERRKLALAMRMSGATYKTIGAQLGVTLQAAHQDVQSELEALGRDDLKTLRNIYHARLEQLLATRWPRALRGDDHALAACLTVLDRIERLYGLNGGQEDAPTGDQTSIIILAGDTSQYRDELNAAKNKAVRA